MSGTGRATTAWPGWSPWDMRSLMPRNAVYAPPNVLPTLAEVDAMTARITVSDALPRGGRMFVVEMLLPDDGSFGGLCDLHLLMATVGRERTETGYRGLLGQAGFEATADRTLAALPSVIEGVARRAKSAQGFRVLLAGPRAGTEPGRPWDHTSSCR